MNYILSHQDEFVKTTDIKIALTLLGEGTACPIAFAGFTLRNSLPDVRSPLGLVFAEGQTHRKQVGWTPCIWL